MQRRFGLQADMKKKVAFKHASQAIFELQNAGLPGT
jgi:hypothetical protein